MYAGEVASRVSPVPTQSRGADDGSRKALQTVPLLRASGESLSAGATENPAVAQFATVGF
jgi:hypothetical protein